MIPFRTVLFALAFLLPLRADYLTNTDLKDSLGGWHGDGQRVFLLPDGSEGAETDTDAVPVIKLKLGREPQIVYQDYETRDRPASLHVTVDLYASSDYKRGTFTDDQTTFSGSHYVEGMFVPDADFWIRDQPSRFLKRALVKPGQWVTIDAPIRAMKAMTERILYFCVPPGEGAVYLKNPHVTP